MSFPQHNMNTTTTTTTLRNKSAHRHRQAFKYAHLSATALICGDIDKAIRLRNKATRQKAWAKRYDMTRHWIEASADLSRMIEEGSL